MPTTIESLVQDWERSKLGAQEYLEAMPDTGYPSSPVPGVLTFAGQFLHLAHANYMFAAALGAISPLKDNAAEKDPELQPKAAATAYVLASYDFVIEAAKQLQPSALAEEVQLFRWTMSRETVLARALEHQVHHRGQTAVYLRLQGVKPPDERLF